MKKFVFVLVLFSLIFTISCKKEEKKIITLSGAFAIYPTAVNWANEYMKLNPNVKIEVSAGGAGKGATDAILGIVDIGMVSREPDKSELEKGIIAIPISHDGVFVIISAKNPFVQEIIKKGIKRQTLYELFIENKKLSFYDIYGIEGGKEKYFNIYTRSDSCGAAQTFAKGLGNKKQEDLKGVGLNSDPQMINAVLKDDFGLSYANFSYVFNTDGKVFDGIKILPIDSDEDGMISEDEKIENRKDAERLINENRYLFSRRNYFFVKKELSQDAKSFIKFCLSEEGTKILEAIGTSLPLSREERVKILEGMN